jgi:hypothetical protein
MGRILAHNIHDRDNLIALCTICHFAYDNDEWIIISEHITTWRQRLEATPRLVNEYRSQKGMLYRRLLLAPAGASTASGDPHYASAFVNRPTKEWGGEPGVLMVRPLDPREADAALEKAVDDFQVVRTLWRRFVSPCVREDCAFCKGKDTAKQRVEEEEDDDDDEDGGGGIREGHGKDGDAGEREEDSEEEEEEEEEEDRSSRQRKSLKRECRKQVNPCAEKIRKKLRGPDWENSAPYDESVPLSYRWGYTWANTTSNELMEMWQAQRRPVVQPPKAEVEKD